MTNWTTTTNQDEAVEALDATQRTWYCFARDWGCGHGEALTIATDDTGGLFNDLSEKTFSQ